MRTIHHPTLSVSMQVPADDVDRWRDQGWRLTKPSQDSTAAATAAEQGQQPEKE